jgi:uncharacterized membrane protein YphA (DoxX/SURF4 family)
MTTRAATSSASSTTRPSKGLHIALWVVQVLLAVAFFMAGLMKLTTPYEALNAQMPWTTAFPEGMVRFIGLVEVLGAIGLVLPSATRIQPRLTPLAALGLVVVMVLASGLHLSRGEGAMVPANLVLGALAAFVAWGRSKKAPIAAR